MIDPKPDFGLYLKNNFNVANTTTITIVDSFIILNLSLYPDHSSTITAMVGNRLASFNFDDNVLKIFIWVLKDLNLIHRPDIEKQIMDQENEPIIITFNKEQVCVTGMVLSCEFGQIEKSETTNEEFLPLIIKSAKIVQKPVAIVLDQEVNRKVCS